MSQSILAGPAAPELSLEEWFALADDQPGELVEYAAFGVRYYWILDPRLRSLEIFELATNGRYSHVLGASHGLLNIIPGCQGLALDLSELWAQVDRLESHD